MRRRPRSVHVSRRQQQGVDVIVDPGLESLDERQLEAVRAVLNGSDVFITGGAGTGKSRTLNAIVAQLQLKFAEGFKDKVAVTATTGCAAINVGGCTLHHITGLRVPKQAKDFKRVGQGVYKRVWQELEVLVIDEASMLSGEFFDRLDTELRRLREGRRLQLVIVGDPYQLPPITEKIEAEAFAELEPELLKENRAVKTIGPRATYEYFLNRGMIFQSAAYWEKKFRVVELTTQHRQHSDNTLAECLRNLRNGSDEHAIRTLNEHCYWPFEAGGEDTITLVPTTEQVDAINADRLSRFPGDPTNYCATDSVLVGATPQNLTAEEAKEWAMKAEELLKNSSFFRDDEVPKTVGLKIGALVMLSSTVDQRFDLVNGQTGYVLELQKNTITVFFTGLGRRFDIQRHKFQYPLPGLGTCIREQIPLRLAWAITHHRSQGKTLRNVVVDPKSFTFGQAYVALSRARGLEDLRLLRPLAASDIRMNPVVSTFERLQRNGTEPEDAQKELKTWQQLTVMSTRRWHG